MTKKLRVAPLVAAARVLQSVYRPEFIHAAVTITDFQPYQNGLGLLDERSFTFLIEGFGHGRAVILNHEGSVVMTALLQFTGPDFTYTDFYQFRHGNLELAHLLFPLLEAKLVPVVIEFL